MSDIISVSVVIGLVLFYIVVIGAGVASYVMTSLAFYTIAKRRQIPNPWLSWIPIASSWIIGSITDDFDEENGFKRRWRVVLLSFSIIVAATVIAMFTIAIIMTIYSSVVQGLVESEIVYFVMLFYAFIVMQAVAAMTLEILRTICVFKIYETTVPEKALKYILLSILVPLAAAICLMKCKDKCCEKYIPEDITA